MKKLNLVFCLLLLTQLTTAFAQNSLKKEEEVEPITSAEMGDGSPFRPVTLGSGIQFLSTDKSFALHMRFRMQNRADFFYLDENGPNEGGRYRDEWQVRRARLRFNGHVVDPKLRYVLQLSFTRGDQDWNETRFPNVVRDAMVLYDVTPEWQIGFGQAKLPGNRQRVVSSGDQQFVDRSVFNALFNIDRDFGFQTRYGLRFGEQELVFKGAITSGEGRNVSVRNDNQSYFVGRVEWLPLGEFSRAGDYFESDLVQEPTAKISVGYTYAAMPGASRANGVIGSILTTDGASLTSSGSNLARRDQDVHLADFLLKYRGWSLSAEYGYRSANDPVINAGQKVAVLTGQGVNVQLGKMLTPKIELAARRTAILPDAAVRDIHRELHDSAIVLNNFLNGHRTKVQFELGRRQGAREGSGLNATFQNDSYIRFQVELGI